MSDSKKSTNQVRKPFLCGASRNQHPMSRYSRGLRTSAIRAFLAQAGLLKAAAVVLAVLTVLPMRAHGQFGIDLAAILAALQQMQSLMSTYISAPLNTINQYEQSVAKYEQQVMYPLAAINQAKNSVTQFESQFSQVSNLFHVNVSSPPAAVEQS